MIDLPPGVTLDEAIETIEARIAEEDGYAYTLEDGYFVRRPADEFTPPTEDAVSA